MSRRPGQTGWIELRNGVYFARFWLDVEERSDRICKRVRICPASGTGSLNASERSRRLKQILVEQGANSEETFRVAEAAHLGVTFQEQAKTWLESVQGRKRKAVKPRTAQSWKSHLNYINGKIGQMQLADTNNRSMREFVTEMASETKDGAPRFSPKSIESYLAVIKSVVASVLNDKDEPIYVVKWNSEYMDVPVVEEQNTPSFTAAEVETIISKAEGQDRLLYAVLAGTGLRIGEAFALKVEDVKDTIIQVRSSAWEGTLTRPKTVNGKREIDLHSSLAEALRVHIAGRATGYVFPSARNTPLRKSNLLRRSLQPDSSGDGEASLRLPRFQEIPRRASRQGDGPRDSHSHLDGTLEQGHAATLFADRGEDRFAVPHHHRSEGRPGVHCARFAPKRALCR